MKIYHFTLLFIAVAFPLMAAAFLGIENEKALAVREMDIRDAIDRAVYSGAGRLTGDGDEESARREALESFFLSLYASFDAVGDPAKREAADLAVPLVLISTRGNLYANIPVCVDDGSGGLRFERKWCDAAECMTSGDMSEQAILKWLSQCLDSAADGAKRAGVRYRFNLPLYEGSELIRYAEEESFVAVYCRTGTDAVGEREVTFASAAYTAVPARLFAITEDEAGRRTYHRRSCPEAEEDVIAMCYSKKECALHNAFPCKRCFGD